MNNVSIDIAIKQAFSSLYSFGDILENANWQGVKAKENFLEIDNVCFRANMPSIKEHLQLLTKPDLPWAEDHFQERISGIPSNPGEQYKNWPYYRENEDDIRFRMSGQFSHTYQERFWPKDANGFQTEDENNCDIALINQGIRYELGDYNDIIERAKDDPTSRQLYLSIWHPEDQSNEVKRRLPCSLGYYFLIRDNTLNLSYFIRSCDIRRHFRNDIYMAIRLAQDFAIKTELELKLGTFFMWIGNLHCWANEKELLKKDFK